MRLKRDGVNYKKMVNYKKIFLMTDESIENNKYISSDEFWKPVIKTFSGEIAPYKCAKIISDTILKHIQKNILFKIKEELNK